MSFNPLEQAARRHARKPAVGQAPVFRGVDRAPCTSGGSSDLIDGEQCAIDHEACDPGMQKLRYLRRRIEADPVVEMAAPVDVGSYRQQSTIDVLKLEIAQTQAAPIAIMDAGVGNLQDAVLACHDARSAEYRYAKIKAFGLRGDALDFIERQLGGEPDSPSPAISKGPHAGNVVHGDA